MNEKMLTNAISAAIMAYHNAVVVPLQAKVEDLEGAMKSHLNGFNEHQEWRA